MRRNKPLKEDQEGWEGIERREYIRGRDQEHWEELEVGDAYVVRDEQEGQEEGAEWV